MEQKTLITCCPVSRVQQRKVLIEAYKPPVGSEKTRCTQCNIEVWIGPKQLEAKRKQNIDTVLCYACTIPLLPDGELKGAGGQSGDYTLDDGTRIARDDSNN